MPFLLSSLRWPVQTKQMTNGSRRMTLQSKWQEKLERYLKEHQNVFYFTFFFRFFNFYFYRHSCPTFPQFVQVIREAGEKEIKVMTKSSTVDLVTKTDERVEKIIIGSLKKKFGEDAHWWDARKATRLHEAPTVCWLEVSHILTLAVFLNFVFPAVSLERSLSQKGRLAS